MNLSLQISNEDEQDLECALDLARTLEVEIDIDRYYIQSPFQNTAMFNAGCSQTLARGKCE